MGRILFVPAKGLNMNRCNSGMGHSFIRAVLFATRRVRLCSGDRLVGQPCKPRGLVERSQGAQGDTYAQMKVEARTAGAGANGLVRRAIAAVRCVCTKGDWRPIVPRRREDCSNG